METELKIMQDGLKARIKACETGISVLVEKLEKGHEVCEQECFVMKDYTLRKYRFIACETGDVVRESPFQNGDDQMGGNEQRVSEDGVVDLNDRRMK